jgi:hypothetical protein
VWGATGAKGDTGADGIAGKDGVGISSTSITYAASSSGTTAPTSGWASAPPSASAGQYVWTRTVWTYTDGTTETGYSVGKIGNTGAAGAAGVSVSSVTPYYCLVGTGASAPAKPTTNPPSSSWTLTEPPYTSGVELWRCDLTVMSNNSWSWGAVSKVSSYTAANAAMDQAVSGAVEVRRNLCLRYNDSLASGGFASGSTSENITVETLIGQRVARRRTRVAGSSQWGGIYANRFWTPTEGFTIEANTTIGLGCLAWANTTKTCWLGIARWKASDNSFIGDTVIMYTDASTTPIDGPGRWLSGTYTSGSEPERICVAFRNDEGLAGEWIQATAFMCAVRPTAPTLGDYFDGSYSPDPDLTPSWTGAENASASVLTRWSQALTVANLATAMAQGLVSASTTAPDVSQKGRVWLVLNDTGNVVGMKISNGSAWSSYTLMADQVLVPSSVGTVSLANGAVTAPKITATSDLWTKVLAVAGDATIGGNLLANGAVTAPKITASNELWAKLATFAKVTTDMLIAGGAKITGSLLADVIQLVTRLVAGDPDGTRTELNSLGLFVYRVLLDGTVGLAARFGLSDEGDYLGILDAEGNSVAAINETGVGSFSAVDAGDSLIYQGTELTDVLDQYPRGAIQKTTLQNGMVVDNSDWSRVAMVTFPWKPDRTWRFTANLYLGGYSGRAWIAMKRSAGSTCSKGSPTMEQWTASAGTSSNTAVTTVCHYAVSSSFNDVEDGDLVTYGVFVKTGSGTMTVAANGALSDGAGNSWLAVEDIGKEMNLSTEYGYSTYDSTGSDSAASSGTTHVKTVSGAWGRSFTITGAYTTAVAPKVVQGGLWTARMGMIGFPSIISDLSGATVKKIEVYLYFSHWYNNSGGTAGIGFHGATSAPATWNGTQATIQKAGITKPGGVWVDITAYAAQFKAGTYRGVTLRAPGDSTNLQYYGQADFAKCKLRYTYVK